jgi:hyperosmotically inducible periplasmic protein
MKTGKSLLMQLLIVPGLGLSLVVPDGIAQAATPNSSAPPALSQSSIQRIVQEVHHQLVLLPYYGVFDNLAYRVSPDGTVTLLGQVVRPTLKSDAENAVKHIEGVEHVDNQIKVLPASPMDDQIRMATYRAIYGDSALNQYALRAVPPIHIIVDSGHVTLEGAVANSMDKQIAETRAKTVPNVFSVTDNLAVDQSGS